MQTSDEKLFLICRQYGELALRYRNKFAGLLPEVYRRRLYKKKGFGSIFEFAAKLAGMSEEQVRLVLNLEGRFGDKPALKEFLVNGEVSVNKLARVASIATPENQEFLANQAKLLSKSALDTLVRDEKFLKSLPVHSNPSQNSKNATGEMGDGLQAMVSAGSGGEDDIYRLKFNSEVIQKLLQLQQKGIDINELILDFLKKREIEIAQDKERLAQESEEIARNQILSHNKKSLRYIPAKIKNLLKQEFGEKCAVPTCMKSSEIIHHTRRFALSGNHNPYFLAPLCEEHHAIAHSIDQKYAQAKSAG